MGRKGKRRKRRPRQSAAGAERPVVPEVVEREEQVAPEAEDRRPQERPSRGLFGMTGLPSPYPTMTQSLAAGFRAAGEPLLIAVVFLFVLGVWGVFAALGRPPTPPQMVMVMALPPVSVFSDAILALSAIPGSLASLGVAVGVTAVRSVVLLLVLQRMLGRLGGSVEAPDTRTSVTRFISLFGVHAAGLGLVLTGLLVLSGFLGQLMAFLLVSGVGLYFLAMAPVIVVAENAPAAEGLRRSVRSARLPGMRHLALVMLYLLAIIWLTSFTPTGPVPPATPSLLVWVMALAEAFANLVVLGAFAYRWLAVRGEVPAGRLQRRRAQGRP